LTLPSLIDSFLVEVGLDPSGYTKGSKEVAASFGKTKESARASAKEMEAYGKQSAAFFGKLKTEALGLFLAFAGASSIKALVGSLLDGDASAGRLAKNLGVATQSVSAYRMVVKSLGGEAGDADSALGLLAGARESLRLTGTTGHDAELMRLGVTKEDLQDPLKALDAIAKTGEKMKREDYFALLTRLGIPPGAIESLVHGKRGLDDMIEAKKRDGAATDEDARKAQEFQAALTDLESKIMGAVRPSVYKLVKNFSDLVEQFDSGKVALSDLTPELVAIGVVAGIIGSPFVVLGAAIGVVAINLGKLKAAWKDFDDWYNSVGKGTDGFFDPIRQMFGLKTGAQARKDGTDVTGAPLSGVPGSDALAAPAGGGGGAPSKGGGQGLAGRIAFLQSYWRGQGYTKDQADGIVAAMQAENGSLSYYNRNPNAAGKGKNAHHAYGLGQWVSKDRRDNFKKKYGHNIEGSNYQEQLDFMAWEMKHGNGGAGIHGATTAEGAMESTVRGFYRPGDGTAGDLRRGRRALGQSVSIGTINVNAPNADANAVAARIPAAINQRLNVGLANQALSSG
jgi:hypothetical protein